MDAIRSRPLANRPRAGRNGSDDWGSTERGPRPGCSRFPSVAPDREAPRAIEGPAGRANTRSRCPATAAWPRASWPGLDSGRWIQVVLPRYPLLYQSPDPNPPIPNLTHPVHHPLDLRRQHKNDQADDDRHDGQQDEEIGLAGVVGGRSGPTTGGRRWATASGIGCPSGRFSCSGCCSMACGGGVSRISRPRAPSCWPPIIRVISTRR